MPVPDEYESPSATYFVADAAAANTAKSATTQSRAAIRLHFI